jgi:hypothetical protein
MPHAVMSVMNSEVKMAMEAGFETDSIAPEQNAHVHPPTSVST